jgi:hypothetical protein
MNAHHFIQRIRQLCTLSFYKVTLCSSLKNRTDFAYSPSILAHLDVQYFTVKMPFEYDSKDQISPFDEKTTQKRMQNIS